MINSEKLSGKNVLLFPFTLDTILMYHKLKSDGIKVACFIDNNPQLWGKMYDGIIIVKQHHCVNAIIIQSELLKGFRKVFKDILRYEESQIFDCKDIETVGDDYTAATQVDIDTYKKYAPKNAFSTSTDVDSTEIFALGGGYCKGQLAELKRLAALASLSSQERKHALVLHHAHAIVSSKCSLRCRWCCQGLQYMEHHNDITLNDILMGIDNFFSGIDYTCEFYLVGGEPLLYKELFKIVKHIADTEEIKRKIGIFRIITNGTISPNDELLYQMTRLDSVILVTNFGQLSTKMHDIVMRATLQGIQVNLINNPYWLKANTPLEYEPQNDAVDDMRCAEQYSKCRDFNSPCMQVAGKRLYSCGSLYFFEQGKIVPTDKNNSISLDNPVTREDIIVLGNRVLTSCKWCSTNFFQRWMNYDKSEYLPVGEQSVWPITDVKKYG